MISCESRNSQRLNRILWLFFKMQKSFVWMEKRNFATKKGKNETTLRYLNGDDGNGVNDDGTKLYQCV